MQQERHINMDVEREVWNKSLEQYLHEQAGVAVMLSVTNYHSTRLSFDFDCIQFFPSLCLTLHSETSQKRTIFCLFSCFYDSLSFELVEAQFRLILFRNETFIGTAVDIQRFVLTFMRWYSTFNSTSPWIWILTETTNRLYSPMFNIRLSERRDFLAHVSVSMFFERNCRSSEEQLQNELKFRSTVADFWKFSGTNVKRNEIWNFCRWMALDLTIKCVASVNVIADVTRALWKWHHCDGCYDPKRFDFLLFAYNHRPPKHFTPHTFSFVMKCWNLIFYRFRVIFG